MGANIMKIMSMVRPWMDKNGNRRFYIDEWQRLAGIRTVRSGNDISSVTFNGQQMDVKTYNEDLANAKVWFDDDAILHIDHLGGTEYYSHIEKAVTKAYSGEPSTSAPMRAGAFTTKELDALLEVMVDTGNEDLMRLITERFNYK